MAQKFIENGYDVVETEEMADVYIINTCTVTNMADRKSRQMLRRVKQINPNSIVVATGCYAQVAKDELQKIENIDLVLGINEKNDIVDYVNKFLSNIPITFPTSHIKSKIKIFSAKIKQFFNDFHIS